MFDQPKRFQRRMARVLDSAQLSQAELELLSCHFRMLDNEQIDVLDDKHAGLLRLHRGWEDFIHKLMLEWIWAGCLSPLNVFL